jgi:hypothetical protein
MDGLRSNEPVCIRDEADDDLVHANAGIRVRRSLPFTRAARRRMGRLPKLHGSVEVSAD